MYKLSLFTIIMALMLFFGTSYALTIPSGIQYYLPITITNFQSSAVAANTEIAIGASNSYNSNLIGFNALAYQQYETCSLNNMEFFFANGTVASSWLEGNMINEQTANSICSSPSAANALSTSANVVYWVLISSNTFLPANTGTASTNTIYLGWAGNYISSSNTLLNGNTNGEAPQLSCSNTYSPASCSGVYGKYDNGNVVFPFYNNFAGSSIPSPWTFWGSGPAVNNGLVFGSNEEIFETIAKYSISNSLDYLTTAQTSGGNSGGGYVIDANGNPYEDTGGYIQISNEPYDVYSGIAAQTQSSNQYSPVTINQQANINFASATLSFGSFVQSIVKSPLSCASINYVSSCTPTDVPNPGNYYILFGNSGNSGFAVQWVRQRIFPPSGVLPGTSLGVVQYANPPKVSIYLFNNQPNSTGANFQQMITFNSLNYSAYEASNLGNIRFYQGSTELYSWCEINCASSASNAIFWVKIPSGIAAGGVAQVNLTFSPTTTNYDDNYAGEAPSLSPSYGLYDNGANVFSLYFNGNTNPSSFGAASGVTVAQATSVSYGSGTINAIQVTGVHGSGYSYQGFSFSQSLPNIQGLVAESNFKNLATGTDQGAVSIVDSASGTNVQNGVAVDQGQASVYFSLRRVISGSDGGGDADAQGSATGAWAYATLDYPSNTATSWSGFIAPQLYSTSGGYFGSETNNPLSVSQNVYMGLIGGLLGPSYVWDEYLNWMRARIYPPGGVMPSESFSNPFIASPAALVLSSNVLQVGSTITANITVSGGALSGYSGQFSWISANQSSNNPVNTLTGFYQPVGAVFSPNGAIAYVANYGGSGTSTVNVINVAQNKTINTITGFYDPEGIAITPSGTLLYVPNYYGQTVNVVNVAQNKTVYTITGFNNPYSVAFNPSGTLAYVANYGGSAGTTVSVVNVATNTVVNTITGFKGPYGVAFNPSGTLAYVTNFGGGTVNVINVAQNKTVNTIKGFTTPDYVAFNPSGTLAYVTGSGTAVNVINVAQNKTVNTLTGLGAGTAGVAFNPSGTIAYVTVGSNMGVINVAQNTTVISTLPGLSNAQAVTVSPSGKLAYVSNSVGTTVTVIGSLPETAVQALPATQTSNALLQLSIYAKSANTLILTFNGVQYTQTSGSNTIYGTLNLYGFAQDNGTNLYGYGSNTVLASNTINIIPFVPSTTTVPQGCAGICGSGGTGVTYTTVQTTSILPSTSTTQITVSSSPTTQQTTLSTQTTSAAPTTSNTTSSANSITTTISQSGQQSNSCVTSSSWDGCFLEDIWGWIVQSL